MGVVSERDTLEQVVQGLGCQKLQLQNFIQDWIQGEETLIDQLLRICPEGKATFENVQIHDGGHCENHWQTPGITKWSLHNAVKQNLRNPGMVPSDHGAVAQDEAHFSTEASQLPQDAHTSLKHRSSTFDDPQGSEPRDCRSQGPGLRNVSKTFDPFVAQPSTRQSELMRKGWMSSAPSIQAAIQTSKQQMSFHTTLGLSQDSRSSSAESKMFKVRTRSSLFGEVAPVASTGRPTKCARSLSIMTSIVTSGKFESLCAAVIFANSVVMGISADYGMHHLNEPDNNLLTSLELFFSIFYAAEVCLRIVVYGRTYFTGNLWKWNWFDLGLILLSVYDRLQSAILTEATNGGNDLSILRMLRLFKMLRLLRMFRLMKFFRELRLILSALLGSMHAILWAALLVVLISYMVAIGLLHGCAEYLESGQGDIRTERAIGRYWSSVGQSMISLFMCTTGGEDWARLAAPLEEVGTFFYTLFIMYISFFILAVMNTITSIFVDAIMENSSRDHQLIVQMELEKKHEYVQQLREFFERIDEDGDGIVSDAEFLKHCDDPVLEAFAASLDLDMTSSRLFFKIISNDGTKPVDVETFVVGCIKLKGLARNMDLMDLIHTTKNFATSQQQVLEEVLLQIGKLKRALSTTGLEKSMLQVQKCMGELIQRQSIMATLTDHKEMLPRRASAKRLIKDVSVDDHCAAQASSSSNAEAPSCAAGVTFKFTGVQAQPCGDAAL